MIGTMILTGSCPRCGTGTLTNDEDMFGVRIFCIMCGHNRDLGKLPLKVRNIRDLVEAVLEYDKRTLVKNRFAIYPPSFYG
jgi:ribosomal protein S27AE|tara:strand:+ start:1523 stop:1765 length:243 start_codon:yes stop_codon:yes gene_type:complete